jgi:hypothetical protein
MLNLDIEHVVYPFTFYQSARYLRLLDIAMVEPYYVPLPHGKTILVFGVSLNVEIKLSSDNLQDWLDMHEDSKYDT